MTRTLQFPGCCFLAGYERPRTYGMSVRTYIPFRNIPTHLPSSSLPPPFPGFVSEPTIRMNKHLGIPVDPPIEFLVRGRRILDADFVADDEAGLGFTGDD